MFPIAESNGAIWLHSTGDQDEWLSKEGDGGIWSSLQAVKESVKDKDASPSPACASYVAEESRAKVSRQGRKQWENGIGHASRDEAHNSKFSLHKPMMKGPPKSHD